MASLQEVQYDPFSDSGPPSQTDSGPPPQIVNSDQGGRAFAVSRASSGATRIVPTNQSNARLQQVDYDPFANMPMTDAPVTVPGLLKATGTGLARSGMMAAGMGGDVQALGARGSDYLSNKFEQMFPDAASWLKNNRAATFLKSETARTMQSPLMQGVAETGGDVPGIAQLPSTADIQGAVEGAAGTEFHKAQNMPERFLQTGGEFALGGLLGPGGIPAKIAQVAVPAVASQTAGEMTAGTPYEPYARTAAALLTGGATALATRPGGAANIIRGQLPEGITAAHIQAADQVMQAAQSRGITLTWPEALSQVAQQPVLTDTQRLLESSGTTRPQMSRFFADRPQQFRQAAMDEFGNIATGTANPEMIGPIAAQTAERVINKVRGAINRATRPAYDAAGQTLVPPQIHAAMRTDPLFVEALDEVRKNPAKNSFIRAQSDRSVAVYDAVAKELEERGRKASNPISESASQRVSAATGTLGGEVKDVAVRADRNAVGPFNTGAPPGMGNYEYALAEQTRLREKYLNPLLRGPLGRIAERPDTKAAIEALFPSEPLENSHIAIATAVGALAKNNPWAAQQLVRAHVAKVFNEATSSLQGGPSQWGAAKFAAVLTGNIQQRANLQAAIESLPNGRQIWRGFDGFLQAAEASGKRQAIGSRTAFNVEELKALSGSNFLGETVKTGLSPGKWWTVVKDKWDSWSHGRNMNRLADILTDPNSAKLLTRIAQMPSGSREAQYIASRLILQADAAAQSRR